MLVLFHAKVLGFAQGDVADLPADYPGLKGAIEGEYVSKVSKSEAADLLDGSEPLSAPESDAEAVPAPDDAEGSSDG